MALRFRVHALVLFAPVEAVLPNPRMARDSQFGRLMKADRTRCSACGAGSLKRSRRRGIEHLLSRLGLVPLRCDDCFHRTLYFTKLVGSLSATQVVTPRFGGGEEDS